MCQTRGAVELQGFSPRDEVPVPQSHSPEMSHMLRERKRQAPLGEDAEARSEEGAGRDGHRKWSHSFISEGKVQIPFRSSPCRNSSAMLIVTK